MKRWQKVLLAVSLALNLAVAGLAAGAVLRHAGGGPGAHRGPSPGAMLFRELDRDTRAELRRTANEGHRNLGERRRAEAREVIALLAADPFDAGALAAAMRAQAERRHAFHLSVQEAWIAKVQAMSAEERAEYAARLEEQMQRRPRKGWHRDGKGGRS
ncbi:periplasmic heavy metal sensor [Roseobacteraceae bacterium NS-SX3]